MEAKRGYYTIFVYLIFLYVFSTLLAARQSGHVIYPRPEEKDGLIVNAGPNLHRMRQSNSRKEIIATGGLENPLKLFDVEHQKQIFLAKNVKHDSLELRVPVWISDIGFFPETSKLITSSRYGHVSHSTFFKKTFLNQTHSLSLSLSLSV